MRITLWHGAAARQVQERQLQLDEGATVRDALAAWPELDLATLSVGVWGRKAALDCVLRDGDRVELYRSLRVDPKLARRERFRMQGARSAGLFARGKTNSQGR
jgi:putative ubiquitin-RnfH superfamily antitoxin RatB of RatAB toxin-antitoxin module